MHHMHLVLQISNAFLESVLDNYACNVVIVVNGNFKPNQFEVSTATRASHRDLAPIRGRHSESISGTHFRTHQRVFGVLFYHTHNFHTSLIGSRYLLLGLPLVFVCRVVPSPTLSPTHIACFSSFAMSVILQPSLSQFIPQSCPFRTTSDLFVPYSFHPL